MAARINGNMYSHASITLRVGQTLVSAFKSISYSDSRERVQGYGAGRRFGPIGQSAGKYKAEAVTAEIEKEALDELRAALAREAGSSSFGDVEFQIVVQYDEPGRPNITDTLNGCTWGKNAGKSTDTADPIYDEVEFGCLSILWNGRSLYSEDAQ